MLLHERKSNSVLDYTFLIESVKTFITLIKDVDISIFKFTTNEHTVIADGVSAITVDNGHYLYYQNEFNNDFIDYRIRYIDDKPISIQVSRNQSPWKFPALQIYKCDKKYLINENWYDKMTFEEQAFQIDSTRIYPYCLLEIYELIKFMEQ